MNRWTQIPTKSEFIQQYAEPLAATTGNFFEDFYEVLQELNWRSYRSHVLLLNSEQEELRLKKCIRAVEELFQFSLTGEVLLLGSFETIDGFARFDRGSHRVFIGADESFHRGRYLDILTVHELTHVARETRPEIWLANGQNPQMSRQEYLNSQTVVEHLFGEGFSCVVSEILVPAEPVHEYVYQSEKSLAQVMKNAAKINRSVKSELADADGDYGNLYSLEPHFAHYFWAYEWVKQLLQKEAQGDVKKLVTRNSQDFIQSAIDFKL